MIRIVSVFVLGLVLGPAARAGGCFGVHGGYGAYGGMGGPQPAMCLARVDDKGWVEIRFISGHRVPLREVTVRRKNDKGEEVTVKVAVGRQTINERITTVPASAVKLLDTTGKPQDAKQLADLLKTEKPVLVVTGPPEVKYLGLFRKDL